MLESEPHPETGQSHNRDNAWCSMIGNELPARKAAFERWLSPDNFDGNGRQKLSLDVINGAAE